MVCHSYSWHSGQVLQEYHQLLLASAATSVDASASEGCQFAMQLQQQGVAEVDSEGTISDPAYLMDIMELREQIDSTADEAELKQLLAENQAKQRDAVQVPQIGMLCWAWPVALQPADWLLTFCRHSLGPSSL